MSILPAFYDADALERVAINLFYGWGYNFYRAENQLRADDQIVRARVTALLGAARECVAAAESAWRREHLPPPSRAAPRPDPQALAGAQALERLGGAIGAVRGQVAAQPVPENDRMTQRHRGEADTLARLIACDKPLAGQAETLRAMLDAQPAAWMIDNVADLMAALELMARTLRERQSVLA